MSLDRMGGIRSKTKRAESHIGDLTTEITRFLAGNPYKVSSKDHPQLPYATTFFVEKADLIPPSLPAVVGDAIHNLRSALDHLAWQLVEVSGNKPGTYTAFPIFDPAKFATQQKEAEFIEGKIKGMRPAIKDAILAVKAYKGGNDVLWAIHDLDIVDKHRVLLAIGVASPKFRVQNAFDVGLSGRYPLKEGENIATITHKVQPNEHLEFAFDVILGESGIFEGQPLLESISTMLRVVNNLVTDFSPFLV